MLGFLHTLKLPSHNNNVSPVLDVEELCYSASATIRDGRRCRRVGQTLLILNRFQLRLATYCTAATERSCSAMLEGD